MVETKLFGNNKKKTFQFIRGSFFFPQWDTRYFIYIPKCLIGIKNVSNLHARATSFTFQNSLKMYRELVEYLTICTIIVVLFFVDVFFFFTHIRKFKGWFFNKTRNIKKIYEFILDSLFDSFLLFCNYSILISLGWFGVQFIHPSVNSNFINDTAIFDFG